MIHKKLFLLLLLLLPVQLGRHFWPSFSYVYGLRIDYLAPTVYLTDILVFLILFFWFLEKRKKFLIPALPAGLILVVFLLANSLLAQNQGAAIYKFFKIIEFALLGFYISKQKLNLSPITYYLSLAVIWSSLIALVQFFKQASLGGIFWWLGERTFNLTTPGIAQGVFQGKIFLRPYATFSHPNSLAGFILVSLILTLPWVFNNKNKMFSIFYLLSSIFLLVISFSRAVWITAAILGFLRVLHFFWQPPRRWPNRLLRGVKLDCNSFTTEVFLPKVRNLCSLLLLIFIIPILFFGKTTSEESLIRRAELNRVSLQLIKVSPFFGVGLNNFIPAMAKISRNFDWVYWLQPVHNIFLLVAAETGLVGLGIFLWFLFLTYRHLRGGIKSDTSDGGRPTPTEVSGEAMTPPRWNYSLVLALSTIVLLGFFDHYWLTLQQNQLLLTIILGLSWSETYNKLK